MSKARQLTRTLGERLSPDVMEELLQDLFETLSSSPLHYWNNTIQKWLKEAQLEDETVDQLRSFLESLFRNNLKG